MDREAYLRAKEILIAALEQPAHLRDEFLRETCADHPDLLAEVRSLLSRQDSAAPLVDEGVVKLGGPVPERIGPYDIVEVLGEGGMGVVYRGRQTEPIEREVAVKVLHAGLGTTRILERFAWERRSLARMDHPHIARILDAGSDGGRPYVVLELVEGDPVTAWCRDRDTELSTRLEVVEKVCLAVQHAHDRGILHRDLKPGNVLVRQVDGRPVPSVIDFGIAKALDETVTGETALELTAEGQRVGTPAYMAPEQLAGSNEDVDVRTDVYALGVLLYELLAGRRPFGDEHLARSTDRDDPPLPSAAGGGRELRGDLDNICLMAIRPEADRRYRSAADLAADLVRHREGRPVKASPDSWRYRAGKAMRRHPALMTMAAAMIVFAMAGVAFLAYHARRLDIERDRALVAERTARTEAEGAAEIAGFLEGLFVDMDPVEEGRSPTTALELLDHGADRLEEGLQQQPANRGRLWSVLGRVNQSIARNEMAEVQLKRGLAAYAEIADSSGTVEARAAGHRLLAICLHDLGRYGESAAAFRRSLVLYEQVENGAELVRIQNMTDLATTIQAQGRFGEALELLEKAVILAESLGTEEGATETAYIRNIRGYILFQSGSYEEALRDMMAALEVQRRLRPGDNMELVSCLNNVGGMNLELGRYDVAVPLIVESRQMLERMYQGEEHPAIARATLHLSRIALARGDTLTALTGFETAHGQFMRLLGEDNPYTWPAVEGLALVHQIEGRREEAADLFRTVVANRETVSGPEGFKTLNSRHHLGKFLLETGDLAGARRELEKTAAAFESGYAADHPRLQTVRVDLAEALLRSGDRTAARALLRRALPILEEVYESDYNTSVRARKLLARGG